MELLLNAVWAVACGMAIAGLLQSRERRSERTQLLHLGLLLCVAAILFPFISISDDIHNELFIIEDSRSTKHITGAKAPSTIAPLLWLGIASLLLLLGRGGRQSWAVIESCTLFLRTSPCLRSVLGRAPPLVLTFHGLGF
jgi:hypothetical protein